MKFILNTVKSFLASIIFFFVFESFTATPALANVSNLTFCKDSTMFQKRLINETKKLEIRKKLYTVDSKEYISLAKEIEKTQAKFKNFEKNNLLCGKDGLPRMIVNGQLDHAHEFLIPGVLFLYITGWIGWVGRKYISYASLSENAYESEIIINVPVAISIMATGFNWPIDALNELKLGKLLASDDDITVSPR